MVSTCCATRWASTAEGRATVTSTIAVPLRACAESSFRSVPGDSSRWSAVTTFSATIRLRTSSAAVFVMVETVGSGVRSAGATTKLTVCR